MLLGLGPSASEWTTGYIAGASPLSFSSSAFLALSAALESAGRCFSTWSFGKTKRPSSPEASSRRTSASGPPKTGEAGGDPSAALAIAATRWASIASRSRFVVRT